MSAHVAAGVEPAGTRIAIVGSGISGLVAAHLLQHRHDVTVFEAEARVGGHAHTIPLRLDGRTIWVDTGFLVYNERNYPGFVRLLDRLGVATQPSDMGFSVSDEGTGLEWRGSTANTVFAQRRRLADPRFLRMLRDVVRFNRAARHLLEAEGDRGLSFTLEDLLDEGRYSRFFREWYLVPMGSAIWSADPATFLSYPAAVFARFFDNHGLLRLGDQPQWRTITGGSRRYVSAIVEPLRDRIRLASPVEKIVRRTDGVEIATASGSVEHFDRVVVATHSDQALRLLSDPSRVEREILGAIRYQPNVATLHTDSSLLPRNRRARAAWNYHVLAETAPLAQRQRATLTYHLNTLQGLDVTPDVCVTLNRPDRPRPELVIDHIDYAHPIFDSSAVRAQRRLGEINGVDGTYYCGAYWRYGFHEDGVQSALEVTRHFGVTL